MLPNNQLHCRQSTQFLGFSFIAHVHIHNKSWAIFKWRFTRSCLCQPYFNFRAKKMHFAYITFDDWFRWSVLSIRFRCAFMCVWVWVFFSNNGCPIRVNYELVRKQISTWPNNWIEKKNQQTHRRDNWLKKLKKARKNWYLI